MIKEKDNQQNPHKDSFAKGALFGALIGAVVGLLYAPKAGKETRDEIVETTEKFKKQGLKKYNKIKTKAEPIIETAKEKLVPIVEMIKEEAPAVIEKVKDKVPEVMETIQDEIEDAKEKIQKLEKQKNKIKKSFFKK